MNYRKGSITVFLTLIFTMILVLVLTLLEGARIQAARAFALRALDMGVNSIKGEYCREVWEDYHLLMFNLVLSGGEEAALKRVGEYINFAIKPEQRIQVGDMQLPIKTADLIDTICQPEGFSGMEYITGYSGEEFVRQAAEYMKYAGIEELISAFGKKAEQAVKIKGAEELLESKHKTEEIMIALGEDIMELMGEIDGVVYEGGKLKAKKYFIKKMLYDSPTMENSAVTSASVFETVKDNYVSTEKWFQEIYDKLELIRQLEENGNSEENGKPGEIQDNAQISTRNYAQAQPQDSNDMLQRYEQEIINGALKVIRYNQDKINQLGRDLINPIYRSQAILQTIGEREKSAIEIIAEYEERLTLAEHLPVEIYNSLLEEVDAAKSFWSKGEGELGRKIPMQQWKEDLEYNLAVGKAMAEWNCDAGTFGAADALTQLEDFMVYVRSYKTQSFRYSYGSVTGERTENPMSYIREFLRKGILELVADKSDEISERTLGTKALPSALLIVDGLKPSIPVGEEMIDKTLLLFYFTEHMKSFSQEIGKDSVLQYEQEYLLHGNSSDMDNLKAVVESLMGARTIINYLYLLTDRDISALAEQTALALVGFSGITPLILVTKLAILMVLAVEESLIDIRALLEGYQVPLLKSKQTFQMKYSEIFLVNKEFIKNRAKKYKNVAATYLTLDYEDYLKLFLFGKEPEMLAYRGMDLIQENIRRRYCSEFAMQDCGYGFTLNISGLVKGKLNWNGVYGYEFKLSQSSSYQ